MDLDDIRVVREDGHPFTTIPCKIIMIVRITAKYLRYPCDYHQKKHVITLKKGIIVNVHMYYYL